MRALGIKLNIALLIILSLISISSQALSLSCGGEHQSEFLDDYAEVDVSGGFDSLYTISIDSKYKDLPLASLELLFGDVDKPQLVITPEKKLVGSNYVVKFTENNYGQDIYIWAYYGSQCNSAIVQQLVSA